MDMDGFGDRLRQRMKSLGITVPRLATSIGVTRQTVYNWLNGVSVPEGKKKEALATRLRMPASELFYGKNNDINEDTIESVIEMVEQFLSDENIQLPPNKKAALIAALVRMNATHDTPGRDVLRTMVKMAII